MLEKQNEIPLQYIGGFSKRDAPFEYSPFFDWQSSLLKRMLSNRPLDDKRKIIFLVDPIGNNGKSVFFQWLSSLPAGAINIYFLSSLNAEAADSSSSSSTSIHNAVSYHTNISPTTTTTTTTMMMAIKEEEDGLKNNQPASDGESKIYLKQEYLSEPGGPSAADDECIFDNESDTHNQEKENLSHEEILLKKEESGGDISRREDRCSIITDNQGSDKDPYSRRSILL
jgi:hypothetical protein